MEAKKNTMNTLKKTQEELENLRHALLHLEANKILESGRTSPCPCGWYQGNRGHFVKRHRKAIEMLRQWLTDKVDV
jgi:hypothetical protein